MSNGRWLAVVGLSEDGLDGLSPAARRLVAQAAFVVGGRRHLALAQPLEAETLVWPSPIEDALDTIEAWRGKPVCVLASGDPFFFGVGTMLTRRFAPAEMICHPAPSAFSLAASRLGWSQQDCALLSLHGRPLEAIIPRLEPGARILALSWDDATPAKLAALLTARGMGRSKLTVCEAMGGPRERVRATQAQGFALDNVAALNTIALEVVADRDARVLPARRRPVRRMVRARRPDHQARHPRDHALRRSRRGAANCSGTSAPARARSPSNGCSPTPPIARSRSKPGTSVRRASCATR